MYAECDTLVDSDGVDQLRTTLMNALKLQLSRSRPSDPHLLQTLLGKVNELHAIGKSSSNTAPLPLTRSGEQFNYLVAWYRQNWPSTETPSLFAEMFDLRPTPSSNMDAADQVGRLSSPDHHGYQEWMPVKIEHGSVAANDEIYR
jgi:hypothetical protein